MNRSLLATLLVLSAAASGCPRHDVARDDDEPTRDARTPPKATDERPQLSAAERALRRATEGLEGDGSLHATLKTSVGDLDCELHEERVPLTVANFVGLARGTREWLDPERDELVDRPLYRDLPFHRVVPGFAVQTGDPTGSGEGGPGYEFEDEFHPELRHDAPGVLSMANHGPNTNGSQFFVTLAPAPHLDGRHTIFGQCETGGVLDALANPDEGDAPVLRSVHIHRETSPASVASDG